MSIKQFFINVLIPSKSTYFKLKIKETWYSNKYFTVSYSTNYGITWNKIKCISYITDVLTNLFYIEPKTYLSIPKENELRLFNSYSKIKEHHRKIYLEINEANNDIKHRNKTRLQNQREIIEKFNK